MNRCNLDAHYPPLIKYLEFFNMVFLLYIYCKIHAKVGCHSPENIFTKVQNGLRSWFAGFKGRKIEEKFVYFQAEYH